MIDPAVARAYASRRTLAELQAIQDACLDVHANGGERNVASGSGSIEISLTNCVSVLTNVEEALRIKAAGADDPVLTAEGFTTGVSFANRLIQ